MPMQTKVELRKIYREKRRALSVEEFHNLNKQLVAQVKQLDLSRLSTVHLFLPIQGNREPDTYAIAHWLRTAYPRIQLVLSKSNTETYSMQHVVWDEKTVLKANRWGIPEPENGAPVSPTAIDAVFVPLLADDQQGHRVGYGKGFYDRFLSECRSGTSKIGLSLFQAVTAITDVNEHDIVLDTCVTPHRIWWF